MLGHKVSVNLRKPKSYHALFPNDNTLRLEIKYKEKKKSRYYKTGEEVERAHDDELGGRVPIFLYGLGLS